MSLNNTDNIKPTENPLSSDAAKDDDQAREELEQAIEEAREELEQAIEVAQDEEENQDDLTPKDE